MAPGRYSKVSRGAAAAGAQTAALSELRGLDAPRGAGLTPKARAPVDRRLRDHCMPAQVLRSRPWQG